MEYRLFEKTELYIRPLHLTGADLGACAMKANLDKNGLARNLAEVLRHKFIAQHAGHH